MRTYKHELIPGARIANEFHGAENEGTYLEYITAKTTTTRRIDVVGGPYNYVAHAFEDGYITVLDGPVVFIPSEQVIRTRHRDEVYELTEWMEAENERRYTASCDQRAAAAEAARKAAFDRQTEVLQEKRRERRERIAKKAGRDPQLEDALYRLIEKYVNWPFPNICVHSVGLDILAVLEECDYGTHNELDKSLTRASAGDEESNRILNERKEHYGL
jgi:hypothetical protein